MGVMSFLYITRVAALRRVITLSFLYITHIAALRCVIVTLLTPCVVLCYNANCGSRRDTVEFLSPL